ncbi:hypothetical protein GCM10020229_13270 [Kitasatospora albolonga]
MNVFDGGQPSGSNSFAARTALQATLKLPGFLLGSAVFRVALPQLVNDHPLPLLCDLREPFRGAVPRGVPHSVPDHLLERGGYLRLLSDVCELGVDLLVHLLPCLSSVYGETHGRIAF